MSFLTVPLSIFKTTPRQVGSIELQVVTNETAQDNLTITKHPVQQGAAIADHSFKEPTRLNISCSFRDNSDLDLDEIYKKLLELQESREPVIVVTPKRTYPDMLIGGLTQTTDKNTENCLAISFALEQVIIVSVDVVQVPRRKQRNAGLTGKTENVGKKSALATLKQGIAAIVGQ